MTQYPNYVQAALLFDSPRALDIDPSVREFLAVEAGAGTRYSIVADSEPGVFWRLFGTNSVMVTVEFVDGRADVSKFKTALSSPFTQTTTRDASERIARHKSHVIVTVHHGPMPPPTPEISELLKKIEAPPTGFSLPEFRLRLRLCGLMSQFVHRSGSASLVHWTSSEQLLTGAAFSTLAVQPAPNPLHIHPLLYDGGRSPDGRNQVVILTRGAAHFLGREVLVLASPVPWPSVFKTVFALIALATTENGYVIPDGDTFGLEGDSDCCRVRHIPADATSLNFKGPLYQLEMLRSREHGYTSPDYTQPQRITTPAIFPPTSPRN